jgi:hypothetical protein
MRPVVLDAVGDDVSGDAAGTLVVRLSAIAAGLVEGQERAADEHAREQHHQHTRRPMHPAALPEQTNRRGREQTHRRRCGQEVALVESKPEARRDQGCEQPRASQRD